MPQKNFPLFERQKFLKIYLNCEKLLGFQKLFEAIWKPDQEAKKEAKK